MGEIIQEIGRGFVLDLKDFLESTENFGSVFTGNNPNQVTVRLKYDGSTKTFDIIAGYKKDLDDEIEVYIEAKNYSTQGDLNKQYRKFLVDCFSVWVYQKQLSQYWKAKYIFISNHPFYCSRYSNLKTLNFLKNQIKDDEDLFNYCLQNEDIVVREFLDSFDILIFSECIYMISVDLQRLLDKYRPISGIHRRR